MQNSVVPVLSVGSEENARHLHVYNIGIRVYVPGVGVLETIGYTTRTSLNRIDKLNAHLVHFLYLTFSCLRGWPNAIFQQDNANPYMHVEFRLS